MKTVNVFMSRFLDILMFIINQGKTAGWILVRIHYYLDKLKGYRVSRQMSTQTKSIAKAI